MNLALVAFAILAIMTFAAWPGLVIMNYTPEPKRRPTIASLMIGIAVLGVALAILLSGAWSGFVLVAVGTLYNFPMVLAGLYLPRPWDRRVVVGWIALTTAGVLGIFHMVASIDL